MLLKIKQLIVPRCIKHALFTRSLCSKTWFVEPLKKRTLLKLSGPDTNNYLQSMMTNDIKYIENSPAIFSLLLNSHGRVLYDILLYKMNCNEYLVEYEKSAVDYFSKHLIMYRLRKNVNVEPLQSFSAWVIYPESDQDSLTHSSHLKAIVESLANKDGIVTSVTDPRNNLLGVRVVTENDLNLLTLMSLDGFNFLRGNSYRTYRYKLGFGEGVLDHPPGNCLPFDTNFDFMNGVSFSKGCYIGQELTARMQFTLNIRKRLMPIEMEPKDTYPDFPPECDIVNEKNLKMGRLRSHLGAYGLALLKYEDSLKSKYLVIKDFDIKLKTNKPKWWPDKLIHVN